MTLLQAAEVLEKQFAAELQELKSTAEEKHQKVKASVAKTYNKSVIILHLIASLNVIGAVSSTPKR